MGQTLFSQGLTYFMRASRDYNCSVCKCSIDEGEYFCLEVNRCSEEKKCFFCGSLELGRFCSPDGFSKKKARELNIELMDDLADGVREFHQVCRNGDLEMVKKMLDQDETLLNSRDFWNRTPLHQGARHSSYKVVELLLDEDAPVNPRDMKQQTPLHLAAQNNDDRTVEVLLKAGAKVDLTDRDGNTPLIIACQKDNLQAAGPLVKNGGNLRRKGRGGLSSLDLLKEKHKLMFLEKYAPEMIEE